MHGFLSGQSLGRNTLFYPCDQLWLIVFPAFRRLSAEVLPNDRFIGPFTDDDRDSACGRRTDQGPRGRGSVPAVRRGGIGRNRSSPKGSAPDG